MLFFFFVPGSIKIFQIPMPGLCPCTTCVSIPHPGSTIIVYQKISFHVHGYAQMHSCLTSIYQLYSSTNQRSGPRQKQCQTHRRNVRQNALPCSLSNIRAIPRNLFGLPLERSNNPRRNVWQQWFSL